MTRRGATADAFQIYDQFSNNSQGMAQFMVWSALAVEGMGATLQHLGGMIPGLQEKISEKIGVPASWKVSRSSSCNTNGR